MYPERSLNEVPEEIKRKYFEKKADFYRVDEEIKSRVTFKKQNLLADRFEQGFDLIICRNVLIYFTEEAKNLLYDKFSASIRSGWFFFVGSTEQIFTPGKYQFETIDTFFYKKK